MHSNLNGSRLLDPTRWSNSLISDVSAVLVLLVSAELSMEAHSLDRRCIESLKRCIDGIKQRNNIAEDESNDGLVWRETTIGGLLCLLRYVEAEVRETLNDSNSAAEIQFCIDRLSTSRTSP
jgi:hypothetical protein